MNNLKLSAGTQLPTIIVNNQHDQSIELGKPHGENDWQLVVVYRGRHCPLCTRYLNELEKYQNQFAQLGVSISAVSADSKAQLNEHLNDLNITYPIGYGLTIKQMDSLGLYLSTPRNDTETDHVFAEPGLFVINQLGQVQVVDISNGPFVRPELEVLLSGIEFIRNPQNNYPIRGTFIGGSA